MIVAAATRERERKGATYVLEVLTGEAAGRVVGVSGERAVLVGRSAAARLRLDDESISRAHCLILVDEKGPHVFDLHSRAGTFLRGRRVTRAALDPGDEIRLGTVVLRFGLARRAKEEGEGASAAPRPGPSDSDSDGDGDGTPAAGIGDLLPAIEDDLVACERCDRVLFESERRSPRTRRLYGAVFCSGCASALEQQPEDFAGYKVLGELGRGGMGVVSKAVDLRRARIVALKAIRCARETSMRDLEYIVREVNVCRSLKHPHIVPIYSVARHETEICFTMKYVSGETLEKRMGRDGALPARVAARILREIGAALEVARKKSIVHRDVKPANILLDRGGRALLTDFGLAKCYTDAAAVSGLTMTGERLIGTPYFMAPEQVANPKAVDHRADLFSLGAVTYFMLTAKKPFDADNLIDCLYRVVHSDPAALEAGRPGLPQGLVAIVERLLRKDPRARFQAAGEVVRAVDAIRFPRA